MAGYKLLQMGMKYFSKLTLHRFITFNCAMLVLSTAIFASLINIIVQPVHVQAQGNAYTYRNAGTIVNGNEIFYDRNITDDVRNFDLAGSSPCTYGTRQNVMRDYISVTGDGTSGTRHVIDPNKKDLTGSETCEGTDTAITISNPASANGYSLYRSGDTVSSYNGSVSFNKTGNSGGAEVFVRNGESGVQCADIVVKDGANWYIFPMAPKTVDFGDEKGTAVSERYDGYIGAGGISKENCRVRSIEIESPFQLEKRRRSDILRPDQGCKDTGRTIVCEPDGYARTGINGNLFAYVNFITPAGWGDDGFQIMKGVGTADNAPPANAPPPTPGTSEDGNLAPTSCDLAFSVVDYLSLKWIVCPVLDSLSAVVGLLNDLLNSQLSIDITPLNDGGPYHLVSNAFRVLAIGLIVVVALIMVVSQATGFEFMSAYSIKRLAPKLAIIILLISFAWPLGKLAVGIINGLGQGLAAVVITPFDNIPREQLGGGSSIALALLGTGAVLFLGPLGLLSLVGSAALTVGAAVFLLGIVETVGFLVLALLPIIIASFALENTRGLGKFGAGAGTAVAIVMIATPAIIAGIRAGGLTLYNLGGPVNQLVGTGLDLAGPLLVTALIIKLGGNITGLLTGIQDKFNMGSRALSKFRGNQISKNMGKMASGDRFKRDYLGFNTATKGAAAWWNADNKGAFLSLNKSRRQSARNAAMEQHENILAARYGKTEKAQVMQHNDGAQRMLSYKNEAEARMFAEADWGMKGQELEDAIAAAKVSGGWSRAAQINAARRLFATGTGYDNLRQVHDTVARVAGKNNQLAAAILGEGNATTKGVGRNDLAAGFGTHMELYNERMAQGHSLDDAQVRRGVVASAKDTDAHTMARAKGVAVNNWAPAISEELEKQVSIARTSSDPEKAQAARREAVVLQGIVDNLQMTTPYAAASNTERFANGLAEAEDLRPQVAAQVAAASQPYQTESGNVQSMNGSLAGGPVQVMERPVVMHDDGAGNVVYMPNPRHDPQLAQTARWVSPQRGNSLNDPHNPNNPRMQP